MSEPQSLLSQAQCYVCEGVDIGQAMELALLAQIAGQPTPTFVLEIVLAHGTLTWTWAGSNPNHWNIQSSVDAETNWTTFATASGASRSMPISESGMFVRMVGANASDVAVTPLSEVVYSP